MTNLVEDSQVDELPQRYHATRDKLLETSKRFELRKVLGHGGMGSVFLAFDHILKKDVALKIPGPAHHRRFRGEVASATEMSGNPLAPAVYDSNVEGDIPYLAMELIQGQTVADRLKLGPLSEDEALHVVEEVAKGLHDMHTRFGLTHRDIKSSNIMLLNDSGVKIFDLGLAVKEDQERLTQGDGVSLNASPVYLAPEDWNRNGPFPRPADEHEALVARDIYALGVVADEMLKGRLHEVENLGKGPLADLFHLEKHGLHMRSLNARKPMFNTRKARIESLVTNLTHIDPTKRPDLEDVQYEAHRLINENGRHRVEPHAAKHRAERNQWWKPSAILNFRKASPEIEASKDLGTAVTARRRRGVEVVEKGYDVQGHVADVLASARDNQALGELNANVQHEAPPANRRPRQTAPESGYLN